MKPSVVWLRIVAEGSLDNVVELWWMEFDVRLNKRLSEPQKEKTKRR